MKLTADVVRGVIHLKFSMDKASFQRTLEKIRAIPGRFYNAMTKEWCVSDTQENREILHKLGFPISCEQDVAVKYPEPQAEIDESRLSQLPYTLRDYQTQSIRFAEASGWNCIIALAPRLGKSIVSMTGTLLHPDMLPVLIVCPEVGKTVWRDDIYKWLHKPSTILYTITPYSYKKSDFVIINFDILHYWGDYLAEQGFRYFIVDESHRVGNTSVYKKNEGDLKGHLEPVKVTEAFQNLAAIIPHRVLLSGTPATSSIAQLQPQLGIFIPRCSNKWWFLQHFCDPTIGYGGHTEYKGFSNRDEFRRITAPVIFRRTKQDVFSELPAEMHEFVHIPIDLDLYAKELTELRKDAKKMHLTEDQLDYRMSQFASLSYTAKRKYIFDWVDAFLENNPKLVIYCWYQVVADDFIKHFGKKAVMVNGTVTADKRKADIEAFNTNDKVRIFIGQISAVKESISLAAADSVLFAEFGSANAGAIVQASERIWMPHLQQEKLCYYYAVGDGTAEEARIKILQERYKMISSAFDTDMNKQGMFGHKLSDVLDIN